MPTSLRKLFGPLLLVAAFLSLGIPSAWAQTVRAPLVALLDFAVPPGRNDAILSREVTDAVAVEMQRTGQFDPISRSQLRDGLRELEFTPPLSQSAMMRLGRSLGVDYIAVGRLERLTTRQNPHRTEAAVTVLFLDVATGEFVNGAHVVGSVMAPDALPVTASGVAETVDEYLQRNAISDAAFEAVETLNTYHLPQATVLLIRDNTEVTLNGGVRNGIRPGQEFIILRNGQPVGRVRATYVSSQDAQAHIEDPGRGIQPGDKARAIIDPSDPPRLIR